MDSSGLTRNSSTGVGDGSFDPAGLRVLVVDDDPTCLKILERMLRNCQYQVTTCSRAVVALSKLRERKDGYDLVLSDVYMPDMDGFKLLEHIGLEMDLPVIMMSADDGKDVVMKGVTHGACDYLIKPVRIEALKNIWQHVVRKKNNERREMEQSGSMDESDKQRKPSDDADYASSVNEMNWRNQKKRKDGKDDDDDGDEREDSSTLKKPRVVWSVDLHQQFVAAVNQLGIEKAVPKKILELMNVPGLTRENVASHLQKYRLYLKRVSGVSQHPSGINTHFGGASEANFGSIASLDGFDLQSLAASSQLPQQNLMTLQATLGRSTSNNGIGISLADQINLLNSNTQIANASKIKYGGQPISNKQVNLLHGLPTTIEPKQLAHLHQHIQSVGNLNPQFRDGNSGVLNVPTSIVNGQTSGSVVMHMTQPRPQFPVYQNQGQLQVDILCQSGPRGMLFNGMESSHSSGLPSSIGQQVLPSDVANQVIGRSENIVNGRDSSYVAVSQASSVNNIQELSKVGYPLPNMFESSGLSSGMLHEALPVTGRLEGLDNDTTKGLGNALSSFGHFNELPRGGLNYGPSHLMNPVKNDPDFGSVVLGHHGFSAGQTNGQNFNMLPVRAGDGNRNLQSISQHHGNVLADNSVGVKVENVPKVNCENPLLTEQYGQDDLMSALFKQVSHA